jgi:hypothetical protein
MSDKAGLTQDPAESAALLAAYVAGQCNAEERVMIEKMLEDDENLRIEYALLNALRNEFKSVEQRQEPSPGEFGWYRLKRDIQAQARQETQKETALLPWNKIAAVAAGVLVVVQLTFWLDRPQDGYQMLSSAGVETVIFQVRFQDDATLAETQQLLRELEVEIVSGPSASGLYRLRPLTEPDSAQAIDAIVAKLQKNAEVIDYARQEE